MSAGLDRWTNSAQSTLSGAMTAGQTTLPITSTLPFPTGSQSFYRVLVDTEIMQISGGQGTLTWTVIRGLEGTSATSHLSAAGVTHDVSAFELNSFRQEFNVVAYGAVGDGAADESLAFQNATNDAHAQAVGGVVFLPALQFKVLSTLTTYANVVYVTYGATITGAGAASVAPLIKWGLTGTLTIPGALTVAAGGASITGGLTVASGNFSTTGTTTFGGVAYTWPGTSGSAGQFLQTNGAGTISWQTVVSGVTTVTGTTNQVSASPTSGAVVVSLPAGGTLPGAWTAATGFTVTTGGLTVSAGGLTISAGGAAITGGITGSLNTAAQPNVTSLGTLTSVTVSGTTTFNNVAYSWPASSGSNGQFLQTNGGGTVAWASPIGNVASVSGTTNQITVSPTTGSVVVSLPSGGTLPGTWTAGSGLTVGGGLAMSGALDGATTGAFSGAVSMAALTATSGTFSGGLSGVTTLAMSGALSGATTGTFSSQVIANWFASGSAPYTPAPGDLIVNRGGNPGTGLIAFGGKTSEGNYIYFDGSNFTFAKDGALTGIAATLNTAAQPNITSLGTIAALVATKLTLSANSLNTVPTLASANGARIWIQSSDPGVSATDGDLWVQG